MIHPLSASKSKIVEKQGKWIRDRVDYSRERDGKPYTFYRDASFSDCLLPSLADVNYTLKSHYIQNVVDEDMKSDLEDLQSINWSPQAVRLIPVCVPKDGNCLLHAASVAVWGVEDCQNTMRDLMLMTVQTSGSTFKKRWWSQLMRNLHSLEINQPEVIDKEWDDVIRSISDLGSSSLSVAVPHRFLEGIHIYILANILRRPIIIVTNGLARSLTGTELQENNIGGLYLPLEWPSVECCKTPIILGYSYSHFCPLLSETQPNFLASHTKGEAPSVFPLVHRDLSSLVVRYLKEEEDATAWDLVQSYLLVKEMGVLEKSGTIAKAPFALMHFKPLEPSQNTLFELLAFSKSKFAENEIMKAFKGSPENTRGAAQQSNHPFYDIEMSSQTEVVRMNTKDRSPNLQEQQKQNMQSPKYVHETNPNASGQCIFEGCSKEAHPLLQNLCRDCFRIFAEAGASSLMVGHKAINPAASTEETQLIRPISEANFNMNRSHTVIPTAPLLSLNPKLPNEQLTSMMADRCNCGYRCSVRTYPYCHECYQVEMRRQKKQEQGNVTASKSHEMPEKEIVEPGYLSKENLLERETGDPKKLCIDYMLQITSLGSPASSFNIISSTPSLSTPQSGLESSLLSENETAANLSTVLRTTSDQQSQILREIMADQNKKNAENSSAQKMLNLACLNLGDKKSVETNSAQSQGKVKERAMANQGELNYETNSNKSIEGFAESFAETDIRSPFDDVEVSEEPECKAKCTNPYCDTYILPPQKLCDKCKEILKKSYEQGQMSFKGGGNEAGSRVIGEQLEKEQRLLQEEKRRPKAEFKRLESVTRGKPCIVASCPNYGDPQMNNMCSLCHFKSSRYANPRGTVESVKKRDKLRSSSANSVPQQVPYQEIPKGEHQQYTHKTQSSSPVHRKSLPNYKATEVHLNKQPSNVDPPPPVYPNHRHHFTETPEQELSIPSQPHSSLFDPEPSSLVVTSMTEHNAHKSLQELPPDSSYSFIQNADKDFEKVFGSIEETWKSSAKKCVSVRCENFGNKARGGYCNACFKVIRRQRILEREAKQGYDVPDGETLESD